ncbi:MAG: tRNA (adenosine(37)-N6)-threonylcarbamoyltransferase complex ATPase subunit type 1 TsaE [Candidatus Omnitrophica bacterium]|nr:tRNA (adenosine(37)-N6)-threonylcarbamoyltransferase complex ATPase subunit type 1 TsaE [Candidatus Omnitrophota bacterium]
MITKTTEETKRMGERLAKLFKGGEVIALSGELGSGKTTFTKGIARGLGVKDPEYVNSPSFVLIKEYKGKLNLYHFDLYRLDNLGDIEYIGIQEYLDDNGVVVIEWAEKLQSLLPKEHIKISISIMGNNKRRLQAQGHGKEYENIVSRYLKP